MLKVITLSLRKVTVPMILKGVALILIISTFFKSLIDIDSSFDSWWYHLPWAARMWNIVPPEAYIFTPTIQNRFDGFPLLAQFLQGFFWFLFQRVQAANLVSFLSLILYLYFLKFYFKVPFYLSTIALLAIPIVQIHATSSYVDLLGNIGLSILIMMTYLLYSQNNILTKRDFCIIVLSATCAANTKPQLIPIVAFVLCFTLIKIVFIYFRNLPNSPKNNISLLKMGVIIFLATFVIFATPIKNIISYGNPFYPLGVNVGGIVLNHTEPISEETKSQGIPKPQKWLYSVLEIKQPQNIYYRWSIDQWSSDKSTNRMGGFFGLYVVFNFFLFVYIVCRNPCRETVIAAILMTIMTGVAAFMPESHKLRYYIYWMIVLVSLNLFLVVNLENSTQKLKLINTKNMGISCLVILTLVLGLSRAAFVRPKFYTLDKHIQNYVKTEQLQDIEQGDNICAVMRGNRSFLYSSYFHPQLNNSYSVQAAKSVDQCNSSKIMR